PAGQLLDGGQDLVDADCIGGATAKIEGAPTHPVDAVQYGPIGCDCVVDEEDVADLLAVAVNRDRFTLQCGDEEMRDPALVFGAELARTVDAAHAEHRGGQPKRGGIVENVLIGHALGAAVRRAEIEATIFADAMPAHIAVLWLVAVAVLRNGEIPQIAVDL